jgi:hypothetical protein
MSGKSGGQAIWESLRETARQEFGDDDDFLFATWDELPAIRRERMEAAAAAVETEQVRLAREDRDQLRGKVLALAAKWDATAARNQRNGQSLIDQGDEYGNEGLAIAEALGACVIELRKIAEPPS